VRLKKFNEEKQELLNEVQKFQQQLNDIKTRGGRRSSSLNGVIDDDDDYEDAQRMCWLMTILLIHSFANRIYLSF
jgi:hypothetical protein